MTVYVSCSLTFGMVFVQLISRLLPFLDPVLERRHQAFHKSAARQKGEAGERVTNRFVSTAQKHSAKSGSVRGRSSGNPPQGNRGEKIAERVARKKQAEDTDDTYLVKWRNFASMLRCRMHILVRAEPTSLVAPWRR